MNKYYHCFCDDERDVLLVQGYKLLNEEVADGKHTPYIFLCPDGKETFSNMNKTRQSNKMYF
ncbi:MAG: hypothetical protein ACRC1P_11410 [Cellulosilyticaceae bacterium]